MNLFHFKFAEYGSVKSTQGHTMETFVLLGYLNLNLIRFDMT